MDWVLAGLVLTVVALVTVGVAGRSRHLMVLVWRPARAVAPQSTLPARPAGVIWSSGPVAGNPAAALSARQIIRGKVEG